MKTLKKRDVKALLGKAKKGKEIGLLTRLPKKMKKKVYEKELLRLQTEMVILQEWIRAKGLRVIVLFEGRDGAGKGGAIKRFTAMTNPRVVRIVALGTPTEREKGQWYFQRYIQHLPSAGEMVLFDRSWYNRAGVEKVMGFCTQEQYEDFLKICPQFEHALIHDGIILVKYWFSISDEEQENRFRQRIEDPARRWKISPMDLESRPHWVDYAKAKDKMFEHTDTKESPWYVVEADDKKRARLNCLSHFLRLIPYKDVTRKKLDIPPRQKNTGYKRPPFSKQHLIPEIY
jgi:polyphosphate kinase 2